MRRPALYRPTVHDTAWARPYTGIQGMAVFYNGDPATPPAPPTPANMPQQAAVTPPAVPPATAATGDDEDKVTITQRRLNVLMKNEKDEGRNAALRAIAEAAGLPTDNLDPTQVAQLLKDAQTARQAQLTEEQRRAEELNTREQQLAAREAAAKAQEQAAAVRERETRVRAALVKLGATGDDLDDAFELVRSRVAEDADDAAITAAAEALKERRSTLFGGTPTPQGLPPAPSGAPAGGPPARTPAAGKDTLRDAARARAIRMGLRTDDAA